MERTSLNMTEINLKVAYYLALNSYMLKSTQETTEDFCDHMIEIMEKINLTR